MISNSNHWIIEQTKFHPDKTSIITEAKSFSYFDFFEECKNLSYFLIKSGVKENSHVGILFNHSAEFYIAINSIWLIGAVVVPLNPNSKPEELKHQIEKAEIKYIITNLDFTVIQFPKVIILDINEAKKINTDCKLCFSEFNSKNNGLIMFTSGSTAQPKAVVHTFQSLYNHVINLNENIRLNTDDRWLASLPLFHIGGFMILIRSLISGSKVIFPDSLKTNDLSKSLQFLPTYASFVTTMLNKFINENISLPKSIKFIFIGGGPIDDTLYNQYKSKFGNVVKVYGSTETCSMVTALFPEDDFDNSIGKPISKSIELKITKIEFDTSGEIMVKSNSLFKEYYNDKELTSSKFENAFFKTGDFGFVNKYGFLFIENRREDIIISGGKNISRIEVENEIRKIDGIEDVYVFGLKDNHWGQIVCVLIQSTLVNEETIKSELKKNLSTYKIPKKYFFVEYIPKNELGKISKKEIFNLLNLSDD